MNEAWELSERDYDAMRELIESAGHTFAQVTFRKKDDTMRTMLVQPAEGRRHLAGVEASASHLQGAATSAILHPNLMKVWDVDRQNWRTINLDTVTRIAARGEVYEYAA